MIHLDDLNVSGPGLRDEGREWNIYFGVSTGIKLTDYYDYPDGEQGNNNQ